MKGGVIFELEVLSGFFCRMSGLAAASSNFSGECDSECLASEEAELGRLLSAQGGAASVELGVDAGRLTSASVSSIMTLSQ